MVGRAFDDMGQQGVAISFLRKIVAETQAHAVVLIVPKKSIRYPKTWETEEAADKWPQTEGLQSAADCDGWFVQLETQQAQDTAMWFLESSLPTVRHSLPRNVFKAVMESADGTHQPQDKISTA